MLSKKITEKILKGSKLFIPVSSRARYKSQLPKIIVDIIKERRRARRKAKKSKDQNDKINLNKLTAQLRLKIRNHKDKVWADFIRKIGKNTTSSRPFWKKINKFRTGKARNKIPNLLINNKIIETDEDKGLVFRENLKETFQLNDENIDKKFNEEVEETVQGFLNNQTKNFKYEDITLKELKEAIHKCKDFSTPGPDNIHNLMLKNLPFSILSEILHLFNISLSSSIVPETWKTSHIFMIPKKNLSLEDPTNYRPISLSSCLAKVLEKIIQKRLYTFLEQNKLISVE